MKSFYNFVSFSFFYFASYYNVSIGSVYMTSSEQSAVLIPN